MALQTYITSTEANYYFPNDTDYDVAIRANALSASFGLVNSFINPAVKIPAIGFWDGESTIDAPHILKLAQGQFYRYILQSSNDGYNQELEEMYTSISNKLRGLQQNEISIPTAQTYSHDVGWSIVEKNITNSLGDMEIDYTSPAPLYKRFYNVVVTASGYANTLTYNVYRDDSASILESHTGTYSTWTIIDNSFSIRFMGYLNTNDNFRVAGIPSTEINSSNTAGPVIKQGPVAYGYNQNITRGQ